MSGFLQRLWVQLSADRKRLGILCVLLATGGLLWMKNIVFEGASPAASHAGVRKSGGASSFRNSPVESHSIDRISIWLDETLARNPFVARTAPVTDRTDRTPRLRELQILASRFEVTTVASAFAVINGRPYRVLDLTRWVNGLPPYLQTVVEEVSLVAPDKRERWLKKNVSEATRDRIGRILLLDSSIKAVGDDVTFDLVKILRTEADLIGDAEHGEKQYPDKGVVLECEGHEFPVLLTRPR